MMKRLQKWSNPFQAMITTTPDGNIYMRRFVLLETPWTRIYVHNLCSSDPDPELHDHPWSFVSIILKGGYTEHTPLGVFERKAGQIIFRQAGSPHHLELSESAWTMIITGKVVREWGFLTANGWESREEHVRKEEAKKALQQLT